MKSSSLFAAAAAALFLTGAASAQTFTISLDGEQQNPPAKTTGSGTGYASYDTETNELTLHVEFFDLAGPETLAHIHMAPRGMNGPIVIDLPLGSPIDGVYTLSNSLETALLAGELYVNLHTIVNPAGELRGQIEQGPFRGACCLPGDKCIQVTPDDCAKASGMYQGDNVLCVNSCGSPMVGACCLGMECLVVSPDDCAKLAGVYQGNGSSCTAGTCVEPPECPCDWNFNGVLNSQDFFDYMNGFFNGRGDYNMDGITNTQDFFDFLTCFFNRPHDCH